MATFQLFGRKIRARESFEKRLVLRRASQILIGHGLINSAALAGPGAAETSDDILRVIPADHAPEGSARAVVVR
ncbi:hypothetical protein JJB09_22380 [Rhizobium sp. KVB221]|uniref:Uncharacterized protein n=1 Tax=Rhizobium setariae TaxID=2801340 RepID=A0A936YUD2_9HYPH|nr:hypothetical protein [Rhizobium setariae]MBL0374764.1 hypothetical protein [Rhizobium setariae]